MSRCAAGPLRSTKTPKIVIGENVTFLGAAGNGYAVRASN